MARLLDGGVTSDSLPYLVMELIEGVPSSAAANTPVPTARSCEVFILEQEFLIDQPVTYANSRAQLLSGMRNIHHKLTPLT